MNIVIPLGIVFWPILIIISLGMFINGCGVLIGKNRDYLHGFEFEILVVRLVQGEEEAEKRRQKKYSDQNELLKAARFSVLGGFMYFFISVFELAMEIEEMINSILH